MTWNIASSFEKKRGGKKPNRVTVGEGDGKRAALYRDVSVKSGRIDYYGPGTEWIDKMAWEMRAQ